MKVQIYRNLNARGINETWSVRVGGLVIGHCRAWFIPAASFVIARGQYAKANSRRARNVFAWAEGEPVALEGFIAGTRENADPAKAARVRRLRDELATLNQNAPGTTRERLRLDWAFGRPYEEVHFIRVSDGAPVTAGAVLGLPSGSCWLS